ncbi:MAG: lipoprotein signal peptidase [Bacteroidetes bacterium]|nr:lipoprotein signal peptidase [Bacteroidota bacterium]
MKKPLLIIFLVLLLDQASKIWVKTNMFLSQEFSVLGDWFIIHFTENYGMAFGLEFAGEYGKLFLSVFRIFAIGAIAWYLYKLVKEKVHTGLIVSISLILAGAIGNMIDSAFYGLIFNESFNQVAQFMPAQGGYDKFLHGRVVDMLYFPMLEGYFPDWFPFWAGEHFLFFRPVFNIADSAITIGVFILLFFQKSFFAPENEQTNEVQKEQPKSTESISNPN